MFKISTFIFFAQIESKLKTEMKSALLKFTTDDLTTHELSSGWNYLNMNVSVSSGRSTECGV